MATTQVSIEQQIQDKIVAIAAKVATLEAQLATSQAVATTLLANIAVTKAVTLATYDINNDGTGLGPKASFEGADDLTTFLVAAIALETP